MPPLSKNRMSNTRSENISAALRTRGFGGLQAVSNVSMTVSSPPNPSSKSVAALHAFHRVPQSRTHHSNPPELYPSPCGFSFPRSVLSTQKLPFPPFLGGPVEVGEVGRAGDEL